MKRVKRILVLVLLCMTVASLGIPSFADVIVEPKDVFYMTHSDECVYNNYRQYTVNTEHGHAYLYVSPASDMTVSGYPNGANVTVSWLYTDGEGESWGLVSDGGGWFKMSDLTVVYDSFSFLEEHDDEMEEYVQGTYSITASDEAPVPMWNYPGEKCDTFFYHDDVAEYVQRTYTDADGNIWGYIVYYMGQRNIWVCMSDPYGEAVAPTEAASVELKAEHTPEDDIPMSGENAKILTVVGVLVGGVVIVTAVVIAVMFAEKKKKHRTEK